MALSDLQVFSESLWSGTTEILDQKVELFNGASRGTIVLSSGAHVGDFTDKTLFSKISGLVRRRNPYGSGTVAAKKLAQLADTMVKVAAGTPPLEMDPSQFKWIQQNPEIAAAIYAQQLAPSIMEDMLNTSVGACYAALSTQAASIQYDATGDAPDTMNPVVLINTAGKFGDRSSDIVAWIMHSYCSTKFYLNAAANTAVLFNYGTINVVQDPFGRLFVISDIASLFESGSPNIAYSLGLVPGAIRVDQNNDYTDNIQTVNGDENIMRTMQAEWSWQLGLKGFTWDKSNGGKAPNDGALLTGTNWDKIVTSHKDLAGVIAKTN